MTFGEIVKRYRMANGLTMEELARQCGYSSRSTINKIEKGSIRSVPFDKLKALGQALHVNPACLLVTADDIR